MNKTLILVLLFISSWTPAGEACRLGCGGAEDLSCYCCPVERGPIEAEPLSWRLCSCGEAAPSYSVPRDALLSSPDGHSPSTAFPWPGRPRRCPAERVQDTLLKPPRLSS